MSKVLILPGDGIGQEIVAQALKVIDHLNEVGPRYPYLVPGNPLTFVCPSEILAHHHRVAQFSEKGVELVGISVDSKFTHNGWRNTAVNDGGIGDIDFPLVADMNHEIMEAYGIVHPDGVALRASFLIDENFDVRHQVVNDLPLGRNVDEMLRMVDALDFHTAHGEVCPAGWNKGDEGMKDTPEGVADYLSKHADEL